MDCGRAGFGSTASAVVERGGEQSNGRFSMGGRFHVVCEDKDGNVKWIEDVPNGVTQVGMQYIVGVAFPNATPLPAQIAAWYIGLINNTGTPVLDKTDTAASHAGWSVLAASGAYSDATRPQWNIVAGGGPTTYTATSTATTSDYNFIGTQSIYGVFLSSSSTLTDTAGTLASTAAFSSPQAVGNGDKLKISYTMSGTLT